MKTLTATGNCVEIGELENGNGNGYLIQCENGVCISITGLSRDDIRANNFLFHKVTLQLTGDIL